MTALGVNQVWAANMPVSKKIADGLGIKPIQPDNISKEFLADVDSCESIFIPEKA
ncbi:hypothetical protein GCM10022276_01700 [Sphingomonas limnosediminicola]|uniref:Uncharacterized protein n=1 Tax=Sphingomonas limnosediminicola TaxID=940133 RepID=A0ABP7KRP9_9SPHN